MSFRHSLQWGVALTAALALSACDASEQPSAPADETAVPAEPAQEAPAPAPSEMPQPAVSARTLTLEGLGDLKVGDAVPAASSWKKDDAQISDACTTYHSPDYDSAYAIVEGGKVRRISVSDGSGVKLVEGIGPGSTEKAVLAAFPGFVSSPHKYVDAPAKYLTQPGKDPRLMFEIGDDGKVSTVHVGMMPTLAYVEGCA